MRPDVPHRFEGREVLSELLGRAGCPYDFDEVVFEFQTALEEDPETEPGDILPLLFEVEPRFASAEEARRFYMNLLGLWDRMKAKTEGAAAMFASLQETAPLPDAPEGAVEGTLLPPAYVAFAFRTLEEAPERERRKAEDRLENRQGPVADFVRQQLAEASPEAEETALGLCVIAHEAFLRAFGRRVETASWQDLVTAHADASQEEPQPHLAAQHEDALDEATELEEEPLPEAERPAISRVLAAVRAALTQALRGLQ